MLWTSSSHVKIIDEPVPFGDVALAPPAVTGRSEAELARAMADRLLAAPRSDTEALAVLRNAFPRTPLTARLAGLAALMRRKAA